MSVLKLGEFTKVDEVALQAKYRARVLGFGWRELFRYLRLEIILRCAQAERRRGLAVSMKTKMMCQPIVNQTFGEIMDLLYPIPPLKEGEEEDDDKDETGEC